MFINVLCADSTRIKRTSTVINALYVARPADEALSQALDSLRVRVIRQATSDAAAVRRLATFGKRHGLSIGDGTIRDLLDESRP